MRNLSQAELAERMHIAISHMSAIECGRSNFSVDVLMRLTEALQVSADWLLFNNTPESVHLHNHDLESIVDGCTPDEVAAILKLAKEFKIALKQAKQVIQNNQNF